MTLALEIPDKWPCKSCLTLHPAREGDTADKRWSSDCPVCQHPWSAFTRRAPMSEFRHVLLALKSRRMFELYNSYLLRQKTGYSGHLQPNPGSACVEYSYTAIPQIVHGRYLLKLNWRYDLPQWKHKRLCIWTKGSLKVCRHLKLPNMNCLSDANWDNGDSDSDNEGLPSYEEVQNWGPWSLDQEHAATRTTQLEAAVDVIFEHGPATSPVCDSCHRCGIDFSVQIDEKSGHVFAWHDLGSEDDLMKSNGELSDFWKQEHDPQHDDGDYRAGSVRELYESAGDM